MVVVTIDEFMEKMKQCLKSSGRLTIASQKTYESGIRMHFKKVFKSDGLALLSDKDLTSLEEKGFIDAAEIDDNIPLSLRSSKRFVQEVAKNFRKDDETTTTDKFMARFSQYMKENTSLAEASQTSYLYAVKIHLKKYVVGKKLSTDNLMSLEKTGLIDDTEKLTRNMGAARQYVKNMLAVEKKIRTEDEPLSKKSRKKEDPAPPLATPRPSSSSTGGGTVVRKEDYDDSTEDSGGEYENILLKEKLYEDTTDPFKRDKPLRAFEVPKKGASGVNIVGLDSNELIALASISKDGIFFGCRNIFSQVCGAMDSVLRSKAQKPSKVVIDEAHELIGMLNKEEWKKSLEAKKSFCPKAVFNPENVPRPYALDKPLRTNFVRWLCEYLASQCKTLCGADDTIRSLISCENTSSLLPKKQRRKLNMEVRATELKVHKDRVDAAEKKRASLKTFCVPKTPEPEETSTEKKKSRTRKKTTTEPVYGPPTKNEAHAMELQRGLWAAVLKKS